MNSPRHPITLSPLLLVSLSLLLAALVPLAVLAQAANPEAPQAWSANVPLFGDLGVSVQSQPAVAMAGTNVLVSWTDERNTVPDIYASIYNNNTVAQSNARATGGTDTNSNLDGPTQPKNDSSSSAIIESNGRAFVAYSTQDDIVLARRDAAGTWISRTELSLGNNNWYADARHPSLVGNGDNLVVVWQDYRNKNWDIYSARCNGATLKCQSNVKVSNDGSNEWQTKPRLASKGNTLIAVWEDYREGASTPHLYASFSADGGASWGANARVDVGADLATNPAVAYEPSGQPWVVWEKHTGELTAPANIYAAKWNGAAWDNATRIDQAPDGKRASNPAIAVMASGAAFVAWEDFRDGGADIYSAYWTGSAWAESVVENSASAQTAPAISASGSDVRVAWQDARSGHPDVFMARWFNGAWVDADVVNDDAYRMANQTSASLAAAGNGDLYSVWLDTRSTKLGAWLGKLDHTTHAWSVLSQLPTEANDLYGLRNDTPAIAIDSDGKLNVLWQQDTQTGAQVLHSVYDGATSAWSPIIQVSDYVTATFWRPRQHMTIAINGSRMAAAWVSADYSVGNQPPNSTIYASWFENGAWLPQTIVNANAIIGDPHPSIAMDDAGNTYVAWADMQWVAQTDNGSTTNGLRADIKITKRAAAGGAWSSPQQVNSSNTTSARNWCYHERPQLRISGSALHVVWSGCVPWQQAIYYSSSADGGSTWLNPSVKLSNVKDNDMQPMLAINGSSAVVVYADQSGSSNKFYSAQLTGSTWQTGTLMSDGATNWLRDQDGRAGLVYEPASNCFVSVFPDHRERNLPQLYMATQGCNWVQATPVPHPTATPSPTPGPTRTPAPAPTIDPRLNKKVYLPGVRRD